MLYAFPPSTILNRVLIELYQVLYLSAHNCGSTSPSGSFEYYVDSVRWMGVADTKEDACVPTATLPLFPTKTRAALDCGLVHKMEGMLGSIVFIKGI